MPFDAPDLNFPGVLPSRQKRSRETTAALLQAGAEMMRMHRREEISIEALCAQVDATVGAFYSRFESKEAYFNALLGLAARDGDVMLAKLVQGDGLARLTLPALCDVLVTRTTEWMRAHEGVLRAALQRSPTGPEHWTPFRARARNVVKSATPLLLGVMGKGRKAAKSAAIGFGFQVVFGTLINAVLNNPGPLSLDHKDITARLGRCLLLQLQAEMTPPRTTTGQRKVA